MSDASVRPRKVKNTKRKRALRKKFRKAIRLSILLVVLIIFCPHPSHAQTPIDTLIQSGEAVSEGIATSVDGVWENTLPILIAIPSGVATIMAVFALIGLLVELMDEYRNKYEADWSRLVWPIVATSLLASVTILAATPTAIRNALNDLNSSVLQNLGAIEALSEASAASTFPSQIAPLIDECTTRPIANQPACLESAIAQANEKLDADEARFGNTSWIGVWRNRLQGIATNLVDGSPLGLQIPELVRDVQFAIASPLLEGGFLAIFAATQGAFQILIEGALLITAFIFPFVIAWSIQEQSEPIKQWAFKMFQVGAVKFFYVLLVGLASIIYIDSGGIGDAMWLPIYTGLGAPLLAFSAVSGGGLAIWQTILSAGGSFASAALRVKSLRR